MAEDGDNIPQPTKKADIKLKESEFITPIEVYMKPLREEMNNKSVKKTLIIP